MKIRAVLETDEIRSDKSQTKSESLEKLKETIKNYLESSTKWKVKSINFLIIAF